MNITIIGTGYVGLTTGVCLAEVGHTVCCIDVDLDKVAKLRSGKSTIFEPGLEELLNKNLKKGNLAFVTDYQDGLKQADVVYLALGTPQKKDGHADLSFIETACRELAGIITKDLIVVTKSTVPVGTNDHIERFIKRHLKNRTVNVEVISNPEFLREGSAVNDTFHGDRIVIGGNCKRAMKMVAEINRPFGLEIIMTDRRSAEMIKYASNAFLATKISFINEIANICEKTGANIEDVALGIGKDRRIGNSFLNAGIGYGGSCFPKDTNALVQIANSYQHDFELLKSVIKVNNYQRERLMKKAEEYLSSFTGKRIAILGLSFKPNTDDLRESASIPITNELIEKGAEVVAYDPIAMENAKKMLNPGIQYAQSVQEVLNRAEMALILTDWDEIKALNPKLFAEKMKRPIVLDGRNCFAIDRMKGLGIEYYSVGRPLIQGNELLQERILLKN